MNFKKVFFFILTTVFLFSCKEKTRETSSYKNEIIALEKLLETTKIDFLNLEKITVQSIDSLIELSKKDFNFFKANYTADTVNETYKVMEFLRKSVYKPLEKSHPMRLSIISEMKYSTKQVGDLIQDLTYEIPQKDTATLYIKSETEALKKLQEEITKYNSTCESAFNQYKILEPKIDSIKKTIETP